MSLFNMNPHPSVRPGAGICSTFVFAAVPWRRCIFYICICCFTLAQVYFLHLYFLYLGAGAPAAEQPADSELGDRTAAQWLLGKWAEHRKMRAFLNTDYIAILSNLEIHNVSFSHCNWRNALKLVGVTRYTWHLIPDTWHATHRG